MNDQQRAAMQMALEALENWKSWDDAVNNYLVWDEKDETAITALREALEQPQGKECKYNSGICNRRGCRGICQATELGKKYRELEAQPQDKPDVDDGYAKAHGHSSYVQPQVEPVAWMLEQGDVVEFEYRDYHEGSEWTPLYTTPPFVEAAIEATKEKAAKVCEELNKTWEIQFEAVTRCADAIRRMK